VSARTACCPVAAPLRRVPVARTVPPPWLVIAAFLAVYLIWGSTYLAMHVAVQTLPPFLMAGCRFVIAGAVLYAVVCWRGTPAPRPVHWRSAIVAGSTMLVLGNGGVSWVQQTAPSNLTAIMVAATPLWMNLCEWLRPGGRRPLGSTVLGIVLGFAGVAWVVLSRDPGGQRVVSTGIAAMLLIAPLAWAIGSIYSRHAPQTPVSLLNTAMQMLAGGAAMLLVGVGRGELQGFHFAQVSASSAWAFVYLTIFGSLIAFTAYSWLLRVSTPAKVSTYAYVNPLIAIVIGGIVLHEKLPSSILVAGALILFSVVIITTRGHRSR
jgi:drug/metabolite transporter (DMT)-like permease